MNIDRLIMQQLSGVHSSSLFFSVWRQNVHYIWCKIEKSAFVFIHLGVLNRCVVAFLKLVGPNYDGSLCYQKNGGAHLGFYL